MTQPIAPPYPPAAMIGKIAPIFTVLVLLAAPLWATAPDETVPADEPGILLLRNGEILEGTISRHADRYVVSLTDGEIRLPVRDVDFVCHSLQEAYDIQSRRIVDRRIEDRLQLANWCLRHNLTGPAAQEIAAAVAIDPNDRRATVLDRRLQEMINPTPSNTPFAEQPSEPHELEAATPALVSAAAETAANPKLPANADDLERMARNLPRGTLESYSTTILPLLLNHCATAGCHSVGTQSKFVLLRPTPGSPTARRLTLRDLHNTLDWVDYQTPAKSNLLSTAHEAHGGGTTPAIEKEESREYQQLVAWVLLATQGDKNPASAARPASLTPRPLPKTNPAPASDQSTPSAVSAVQTNMNPNPGGAGWANAIAPSGKVPIHTGVPASGTAVTPPTISKPPKSSPLSAAGAAKTTDPNVKPAAADIPQSKQ